MRLSGLLCAAVAFLLYDCAATTTETLTDSTNKDTRSLRNVDAEREDREERGMQRLQAKLKGLATKVVDHPISPAKWRATRSESALKAQLIAESDKQGKKVVLELCGQPEANFDKFLDEALKNQVSFKEIFDNLVKKSKVTEVRTRLENLKTDEADKLSAKIGQAAEALRERGKNKDAVVDELLRLNKLQENHQPSAD